MNVEYIRNYCIKKEFTTEEFPFGPDVLVFKKKGKIFLMMSIDSYPLTINVKCNPEKAIELREQYDFIVPGYHMNKKHWNTIEVNMIPNIKLLHEWIDDSYQFVK